MMTDTLYVVRARPAGLDVHKMLCEDDALRAEIADTVFARIWPDIEKTLRQHMADQRSREVTCRRGRVVVRAEYAAAGWTDRSPGSPSNGPITRRARLCCGQTMLRLCKSGARRSARRRGPPESLARRRGAWSAR